MGLKIQVGKKYEGKSNDFSVPDGDYVGQIIDVESTKGRVQITMVTSRKRFITKTFFLISKENVPSERALRELADFVTTSMQIDDEEVETDVGDCLGYYIAFTVKNSSYVDKEGKEKSTTYINKFKRADCFPDGTPSLFEEMSAKRARSKAERAARQRAMEEAQATEESAAEEPTSEGTVNDLLSSLGL